MIYYHNDQILHCRKLDLRCCGGWLAHSSWTWFHDTKPHLVGRLQFCSSEVCGVRLFFVSPYSCHLEYLNCIPFGRGRIPFLKKEWDVLCMKLWWWSWCSRALERVEYCFCSLVNFDPKKKEQARLTLALNNPMRVDMPLYQPAYKKKKSKIMLYCHIHKAET